MSASILDSVKKVVGLDPSYTEFDTDIIMFTNAALGTLLQLGAGPTGGVFITDNTTTWSEITDRSDLTGMIQSWTTMKVRLAFDPPATSFAIEAISKNIEELEWRINIMAEIVPAVWWLLVGLSEFPTGAVDGDWGYDSETGDIYVDDVLITVPALWNLTGLSDFPDAASIGELGYDTSTGDVWRKTV